MSKRDPLAKSLYRNRPSGEVDKGLVKELQAKLQEIIQRDPEKASRLLELWLEADEKPKKD